MPDEQSDREPRPKVARLIEEYELGGLGADLEQLWNGDGVKRKSLRDLATYFNRQLVKAALRASGANPVEGEVENIHRLLTNGATTSGSQTRVVRRLEREGIDAEALQADFVSHQAIHTYLTDVREATHEKSDNDPVESGITTVQQLQGRATTVSETTIANLRRAGHINVGDFDVITSISVICRDCDSQYELTELLERRHCDCA